MKVIFKNKVEQEELLEEVSEELDIDEIKVKAFAVFEVLKDIPEEDDESPLMDMFMDFIDLDIVDLEKLNEYLDETIELLEIQYDVKESVSEEMFTDDETGECEYLDEASPKKKKIVRNGKITIVMRCPKGYKKVGRSKCVKIPTADLKRRSRLMKRVWRTKMKSKIAHMTRSRKKSNRKRRWKK